MKRIGPVWWISGVGLLLGAGALLLLTGAGGGEPSFRSERVDRGGIVAAISATGTLNAVTTVQVGSQITGTIARLGADFNSVVREGDLLAQLDPTFLQASVNEQQANVDRASAQVNEAERNFARTTDLFRKSLVSQADLDAATTALESARATLKQTGAALDRARVNLRYATIRAPIGGVVISRAVDVGQTVAASLQAPTLFTIAQDLRKMQVEASVDEADIGSVKPGQRVTFTVDAFPEEQFEGRVGQIRLAPVITQNVVTYTVIILVANPSQRLMPGMTATVSIEVGRSDGVLRVPLQATRFSPPSDEAAPSERPRVERAGTPGKKGGGEPSGRVWVLEDGKPRAVRFLRGLQNARYVEVLRGSLKEGDEVIVAMEGGEEDPRRTQNPFVTTMPRGGRRGF
ncbi:MAG: efflux RND transporter periplasmic adaptor subunit [Bacteroidota bacterium]